MYQAGNWLSNKQFIKSGDFILMISFRIYSLIVNHKLKDDNSDVIIIRCGFGSHIKVANKLRICDLSMAHPYLDASLISGEGFNLTPKEKLNRVSKLMVKDLEIADKIIVISDFIKKTCILAGIESSKIYVAYLPPAHEFINYSNTTSLNKSRNNENEIVLFVGTLSYRKGIDIVFDLAKASEKNYSKFKFIVIGSWSGVESSFRNNFVKLSNITCLPWVSRSELISHYSNSTFLLCPTRADGGARVITEAMLFGNIVLTSTVSGSPITSGFDGFEFDISVRENFISDTLDILYNHTRHQAVGLNATDTVRKKLSYENYVQNILIAVNN